MTGVWCLYPHLKQIVCYENRYYQGDEELDYQQTIRETEIHTLTTPRCGAYQLRLADGTQVWLNAESRLKYPSRLPGEQRVVELEGKVISK